MVSRRNLPGQERGKQQVTGPLRLLDSAAGISGTLAEQLLSVEVLMKLSQIALVSVTAATCCVGLRAYQRVADFGFGNDDSPSNVKAEFYWSRLAYTSNMQSFGGGYGGRGFWGRSPLSRRYLTGPRHTLFSMPILT